MDYFSHGIWSYLLFHNRKKVYLAVIFGLLPDTISFFIYFLYRIVTGNLEFGKPEVSTIPDWVFFMYGLGHSFIVISIVFLTVYLARKKIPYYIWAWPIAVFIDMLTHTRDFLPTPILWPVSDWVFPGISWSSLWFLMVNFSLMLLLTLYIYYKKRKNLP